MNKAIFALLAFFFLLLKVSAQTSGSFKVNGDFNNYYPVVFYDPGFDLNLATELTIARSNIHTDVTARGSVVGFFRYHISDWGHGSNFIDADIKSYLPNVGGTFVGGWVDASTNGNSRSIVIWLRGGGTTYYYYSNLTIPQQSLPAVYDVNPYPEPGGPTRTYKTTPDPYVNIMGSSNTYGAYFLYGNNYFGGSVAIGTYDAKGYQLAVNGKAIFTKVVVKPAGSWPDYVFHSSYPLRPLTEVEEYIQQNHHLPEVPSEEEVKKNGVDVGDNQATLLKKIEELTLYVIEQQKGQQQLNQRVNALEKENEQLKQLLNKK